MFRPLLFIFANHHFILTKIILTLESLRILPFCVNIPSLTLMGIKNGSKPSNNAGYSRFSFGNDLCYFSVSSVLLLFIMLRMADLEINS